MKNSEYLMSSIAVAFVLSSALTRAETQWTNRSQLTPNLQFEIWGDRSNVKAPMQTNLYESRDQLYCMVTTTNTQGVVFALLPKRQSFIFDLQDDQGKPVAKTAAGIKNSEFVDVNQPARTLKIRHRPVTATSSYFHTLFVPEDFFVITNKGRYELRVQMRAWAQNTNGQYGVVISPPVSVPIMKR